MQKEEVKAFKYELRNYRFILTDISTLERSIEYLYERLGGVRGVDPSREPSHVMPDKDLEYKLRDDISRLEAKLSLRRKEKERVDQILARIEWPIDEAIKEIYIKGRRTEDVAIVMYLSANGLHYRINRAIERSLDAEKEI